MNSEKKKKVAFVPDLKRVNFDVKVTLYKELQDKINKSHYSSISEFLREKVREYVDLSQGELKGKEL